MSLLKEFVGTRVKILTIDGSLYIGNLEGCDQNTNIVLTEAKERVFSTDEGVKEKSCGGILIRGDDIICIGLFDDKVEQLTDYTKIFANRIKDSKNR